MKSKRKPQTASRAKVELKDLKPKKDANGGNRTVQFSGGVRVASADVGGDN